MMRNRLLGYGETDLTKFFEQVSPASIASQEKHPIQPLWLFLMREETSVPPTYTYTAAMWNSDTNALIKKRLPYYQEISFLSSQFIIAIPSKSDTTAPWISLFDYSLNNYETPPEISEVFKADFLFNPINDKPINYINLSFDTTRLVISNSSLTQTLSFLEIAPDTGFSLRITKFFKLPFKALLKEPEGPFFISLPWGNQQIDSYFCVRLLGINENRFILGVSKPAPSIWDKEKPPIGSFIRECTVGDTGFLLSEALTSLEFTEVHQEKKEEKKQSKGCASFFGRLCSKDIEKTPAVSHISVIKRSLSGHVSAMDLLPNGQLAILLTNAGLWPTYFNYQCFSKDDKTNQWYCESNKLYDEGLNTGGSGVATRYFEKTLSLPLILIRLTHLDSIKFPHSMALFNLEEGAFVSGSKTIHTRTNRLSPACHAYSSNLQSYPAGAENTYFSFVKTIAGLDNEFSVDQRPLLTEEMRKVGTLRHAPTEIISTITSYLRFFKPCGEPVVPTFEPMVYEYKGPPIPPFRGD